MERNELKNVLKKMLPAIAKPGDAQARDSLIFKDNIVLAFNDSFGVQLALESGVNCAVMAEPLMKLLNANKTKEVAFEVEGKQLKVVSGKSAAHIPLMETKLSQKYLDIMPGKDDWRKLPPDFTTRLAIAALPSQHALSGVLLRGDVLLAATDNWIVHVNVEASLERCWLSLKSISALLKFGHVHEIAMVNSWVHFRNEQGMFSCRHLMSENYPDDKLFQHEKYWSKDGELLVKGVLSEEVMENLKEARVFAEEDGDASLIVSFTFRPGELSIQTKASIGAYETTLPLDLKMDDDVDEITVTTDLARVVEAIKKGVINFQLFKLKSDHLISFSGDQWQMLLAATAPRLKRGK